MFFEKLNISLFKKIMVIFLIVIAPIFVLGVYIRVWGAETVRHELTVFSEAQIEFYLSKLEKEIERLKILQYTCLTDENLNRLSLQYEIMSPYEIASNTRQLQERLSAIEFSSPYVKNVNAHIFSINKTISSSRGSEMLDSSVNERMNAVTASTGAQIIRYQDGLFLATVYPLNKVKQNSNFVIEIEVNQETFKTDLEELSVNADSGSFLFDVTNQNEIASANAGMQLNKEDLLYDVTNTQQKGTGVVSIENGRYHYAYAMSDYLDLLLLRYQPEDIIFTPLKNFTIWLWLFVFSSLVAIAVFTASMNRFINKPIKALVAGFRKVEKGEFEVSLDTSEVKSTEFAYLYARFNKMADRLNILIDQAYKQKILMQRAELKQLQAQIKPHFLYNSFFIINTMAQMGDENLVEFTNHLGEYYRYLTRNAADIIPLKEEVAHANTYMNIQMMRFSKNLTVEFEECPEGFKNYFVPRLILQPIIENAFEHAVEKRAKEQKIRISFKVQNNRLQIYVEDNGTGLTDETLLAMKKMLAKQTESIEVTALINIHRRLKLQHDEMSGVFLERSSLGGLCVVLVLGLKVE